MRLLQGRYVIHVHLSLGLDINLIRGELATGVEELSGKLCVVGGVLSALRAVEVESVRVAGVNGGGSVAVHWVGVSG